MLGSFEEEEGREGEKPGWSRWGRRGRGRRVRTPPPSAPATTSARPLVWPLSPSGISFRLPSPRS